MSFKQFFMFLAIFFAIYNNSTQSSNDEVDETVLNTQLTTFRQNYKELKKLMHMHLSFFKRLSVGLHNTFPECPKPEIVATPRKRQQNLPTSCADALKLNEQNGIRKLHIPDAGIKPFNAFCMHDRNKNGSAWTVLLRRQDGSFNFHDRTYEEFKYGFGNTNGEHWIGLDRIHAMTYFEHHEIWTHIKNDKGEEHPEANHFAINDEESGYMWNIYGNVVDNFQIYDSVGQRFSTKTKDYSNANCVKKRSSSWWWYEIERPNGKDCSTNHFFGQYGKSGLKPPHTGIYSHHFEQLHGTITYIMMAIRPVRSQKYLL